MVRSLVDAAKDVTGIAAMERRALLRGKELGRKEGLEEVIYKVFGGEDNLLRTNMSGTFAAYHEYKSKNPNRQYDGKVPDIVMQYAIMMNFLRGFEELGVTIIGYSGEDGLESVRYDPRLHATVSPNLQEGNPAQVWKVGIALHGKVLQNLRPVVRPIIDIESVKE